MNIRVHLDRRGAFPVCSDESVSRRRNIHVRDRDPSGRLTLAPREVNNAIVPADHPRT